MPGLALTLGGRMDASLKGVLAQSVAEGKAASMAIQKDIYAQQKVINSLSLTKSSTEANAWEIVGRERYVHQQMLKMRLLQSAQERALNQADVAARVAAEAEKVAANKAAMAKITQQEFEQGVAMQVEQEAEVAARIAAEAEKVAAVEAANLLVARGFGASANNPSGLHGGGGLTGIIRESVVIAREIAMGRGGGRIAGSVTLLAQYMGLLGKVVHSTAAEQLLASAAASKLSQSMAAEAEAARGTAAFSGLLTAARKQEVVATEAATKAEIALQTAKVTINPFGWVLIAGIAVTAVFAGWIWHLHKLAVEAKNLADLMNPFKKSFTDEAKAMQEDAKAAQEFHHWLKELNDEHSTEIEKIDAKLKLLRDEAKERREIMKLRGASAAQLNQMDIDQLELERKMLQGEQDRLKGELAAAEYAAAYASAAAKSNPTNAAGVDLHGAKRVAENAGKILDAVTDLVEEDDSDYQRLINQKKMGKGSEAAYPYKLAYSPFAGITTADAQKMTVDAAIQAQESSKRFGVKVGNKEIPATSITEARAAFDAATKQADDLEALVKQRKEILADTKKSAKEIADALKKNGEEIDKITGEIGVKSGSGKEAAELENKKGRAGIAVSEWERAGGSMGGPAVALLDVAKATLFEIRGLRGDVKGASGGQRSPWGGHK